MHASHVRIAVAASGMCLALAGLMAGPVRAAGHAAAMKGSATRAASSARSAAGYFSTSGGLTGVAAVSASNAWAVGYAGSTISPKVLMVHWDGKKWSRLTSLSVLKGRGELNAITVVSAKDAWAAGFTGGYVNTSRRTLLLHWNGTAWSEVQRPAPIPGFLNAVTATASGGWAVGGVPNGHNQPHSLALRLSGTKWSRVPMPGALALAGVAITGKASAWAIGFTEQQSEFVRWNGRTWTLETSILPVRDFYLLNGIAARAGGPAFTVGHEFPNGGQGVPAILKLSGSTWKKVAIKAPSNAIPNAVTFGPGGTAWAAGSTGSSTLILRRIGTTWRRVASPSPGSVDSLDGLGFSSARDGWAVGSSGSDTLILRWNGSKWSTPPGPSTGYTALGGLLGVAAASNSRAWAVGYTGGVLSPKVLMIQWNGSRWSRLTSPSVLTRTGELTAITVVSASDAWAVGFVGNYINQSTLLLHWNGTTWSRVTNPAPIKGSLNAVTVTATGGWAVGDVHPGGAAYSPLILRLVGTKWSRPATKYGTHANDDLSLSGVAVISGNSAWAIGNTQATSALAHWNGSTWASAYSLFPLPSTYAFGGIAAGPGGTAFAVGIRSPGTSQRPFSVKLAGTTWRRVTVDAPANAVLGAVCFAPGGAAWAAGADTTGAIILRWTGKAWARISSTGTSGAFHGLGFPSASYGWAVGTSGPDTIVLHWNGSTWI